jgi:hypothetical protein
VTGKDDEFRESCIVVPVQNGWSVYSKHIIRLLRTHHPFAPNASSVYSERIIRFSQTYNPFCFSLFYVPSPAFSLSFRASSFLFSVAR